MARPRPLVAVLFTGLALLAGCSKESPSEVARGKPGEKGVAGVPDDLAKLVPPSALVLVYAPSLESLNKRVSTIVKEFQPGVQVDVLEFLTARRGTADPIAEHVDRSRPVAIAVSVLREATTGPNAPRPIPTFILPVRDVAAAKAAVSKGGSEPASSGGYIAVTAGDGFGVQAAPAAITKGLPGGDIVLRLELGKAVEMFRPQIEELFGSAKADAKGEEETSARGPGAALSKAFAKFGTAIRDFLDSSERLDLGFWLDEGKLEVEATYTVRDGSKLATTLAAGEDATPLAAALPREFPFEAVLSLRMEEVQKLFTSFTSKALEGLEPEERQALERQQALGMEAYAQLRGATVLGLGFGKTGMEGVMLATVKDAQAYREKSDAVYANLGAGPDLGVHMTALPATKVGGVDVRGWTMQMDLEKVMARAGKDVPAGSGLDLDSLSTAIFGKDGLRVREAVVGDRLVSVIGGDDALLEKAITAAKGGGKPPPGLAAALGKGAGKPAAVVRVELREIVTQIIDLVRAVFPTAGQKMPAVPAGPPLPLLVYATTENRTFHGGLSADVLGIVRMVKTMTAEKGPPK